MGRRGSYSFEKRQKELKRQKKKEEKLAKKRAKKEGPADDGSAEAVEGEADGAEGVDPAHGASAEDERVPAPAEPDAEAGPG